MKLHHASRARCNACTSHCSLRFAPVSTVHWRFFHVDTCADTAHLSTCTMCIRLHQRQLQRSHSLINASRPSPTSSVAPPTRASAAMEEREEDGKVPPPFQTFMRPIPLLLTAPPCPRRTYPPPSRVTTAHLPDEVLLSIFERLPRVKDIAAIRSVCTSWRTLVDTNSAIWRSIVFELPRCPSSAPYAELWYRKAADYGNAQAQVRFSM